MEATLEDAIALAVEAHRGQQDKAGRPYILHPLRVMMRVANDRERMVAVLHDVLEDTPHTAEDLLPARGFPADVVEALRCLSRHEGETYEAFIERLAVNPLAVAVKKADLADNMDVGRLATVTAKDAERLSRYLAAKRRLDTIS